MTEWFADDAFWKMFYPILFTDERFAAAGFASVEVYGNLDGAEYGPEAERLIAVARK